MQISTIVSLSSEADSKMHHAATCNASQISTSKWEWKQLDAPSYNRSEVEAAAAVANLNYFA